MAIIGFSRSAKMGVSAIVGLGNKADIDEDDLSTFFEQDDNTSIIVQHCEDLKDGRAFAEVAKRVSKRKPVVVLKAGRTALGSKAASSHTGALAGNDKIDDDVFRQSGVIRARSLREMLEFARALPILPTPRGDNIVIIRGAGGSGVLLSDAVVDNGLSLMAFPPDLDAAFKKFIPPFGASAIESTSPAASRRRPIRRPSGSVSKTRGSIRSSSATGTPSSRRRWSSRSCWRRLSRSCGRRVSKAGRRVAGGDVEVEEASEYLFAHNIPAYPDRRRSRWTRSAPRQVGARRRAELDKF